MDRVARLPVKYPNHVIALPILPIRRRLQLAARERDALVLHLDGVGIIGSTPGHHRHDRGTVPRRELERKFGPRLSPDHSTNAPRRSQTRKARQRRRKTDSPLGCLRSNIGSCV